MPFSDRLLEPDVNQSLLARRKSMVFNVLPTFLRAALVANNFKLQ